MINFFFEIYPFTRYSIEHWLWIIFAIVYTLFWLRLGSSQKTIDKKYKTGLYLSSISLAIWILATLCNIIDNKLYSISTIIPFHLCYFLNIMFVIMHFFRIKIIFDVWFCWVMAACLQGLFTADLNESFPHYINIRYFIVHISLVINMLYCFFIYKFRVSWKHIIYSAIAGNLYYGLMKIINPMLKTNFMYTELTPPGTILDLLGDNFYIKANLLSIILFTVVSLPFIIISKKRLNN